MWRTKIALGLAACLLLSTAPGRAERLRVKTLVPTFGGAGHLGANVSTILALRLWTTLRPRPTPNPDDLDFGVGQIEWSRRVIEGSPESAVRAAGETESDLALFGAVEEYGPGLIVTATLVVQDGPADMRTRRTWAVVVNDASLELGLPNMLFQFSPLVISNETAAKYSRPDQIRVCPEKSSACAGERLGNPFRAVRLDGDYVLVRQPSGRTGWAWLPDLSEAQGEVVDFTAALISYLRGDFEQAERYFARVRESKAERPVRSDAALLAAVAQFRRSEAPEALDALRAAHRNNPYSRFAVQALVMANIAVAGRLAGDRRVEHVNEAIGLIGSYRHLFVDGDPWLRGVVRSLGALQ